MDAGVSRDVHEECNVRNGFECVWEMRVLCHVGHWVGVGVG